MGHMKAGISVCFGYGREDVQIQFKLLLFVGGGGVIILGHRQQRERVGRMGKRASPLNEPQQ